MNYYTFKPQLHPSILARVKRSTIRAKQKVKPGETFACRYWTARPYDSPMGTLGTATCICICGVTIMPDRFTLEYLAGSPVLAATVGLDDLAQMEGFTDWADMRDWFIKEHKIDKKPLHGVLTFWGDTFQEAKP